MSTAAARRPSCLQALSRVFTLRIKDKAALCEQAVAACAELLHEHHHCKAVPLTAECMQ